MPGSWRRPASGAGYGGFTVDKTYTASTATAVKKWQKALGLPETGMVEPGRIHYAAGGVRVDSQVAAVGDGLYPAIRAARRPPTEALATP